MSWPAPGPGGLPRAQHPTPQGGAQSQQQYANYGGVGAQYWSTQAPQQHAPQQAHAPPPQQHPPLQQHAPPQPQQFYQYPPHTAQSVPTQAAGQAGWEENWNWGWDKQQHPESWDIKQQNTLQSESWNTRQTNSVQHENWENNQQNMPTWEHKPANHLQSNHLQSNVLHQPDSNSNMLNESFGNDQSWSWQAAQPQPQQPVEDTPSQPTSAPPEQPTPVQSAPVHSLADREIVQERRPDLALGKRHPHLEDLTPQWSVESQMSQSQESTDRSTRSSPTPDANLERAMQDLRVSNEETPLPGLHEPSLLDEQNGPFQIEHMQSERSSTEGQDADFDLGNHPALPARQNDSYLNWNSMHAPPTPNRALPSEASSYLLANLEIPPDNSERPDPPQFLAESDDAPQSDRNEYLQTEHLSGSDYTDYGRGVAAGEPGPPPGLARMVPGQNTDAPYRDRRADGQTTDARGPLGRGDGGDRPSAYSLDRLVPGESSEARIVTGVDRDAESNASEDGENLQDLSSTELSFRDQRLDGADPEPEPRQPEPIQTPSDAPPPPPIRVPTSGEDTDRDRAFKSSPRRERRRDSREKDREGRYRDDRSHRTSDREERYPRSDREDRYRGSDREDRSYRGEEREERRRDGRSRRGPRYDTEDTDYNSDRERDRRKYREGSHASTKPPRPEDKDRRSRRGERDRRTYDDREKRYDDREKRYEDRDKRYDDREKRYSDREKRYGERDKRYDDRDKRYEDQRRPGYGSLRRRGERHYGDYGAYYGYGDDNYAAHQEETYRYYEQLRRTDPAAYMVVYKQLLAGHPLPPPPRTPPSPPVPGSVHSGRSNLSRDPFDGWYGTERRPRVAPFAPSDITDCRDLTADATLSQLDDSGARSDRMTPFKFCTAHVKASLSGTSAVVVRAAYPAHGERATVSLMRITPRHRTTPAFPGPLVHGVTHKATVVEWCEARARDARSDDARDAAGLALVWDLLVLLLRQNGVVVGADVAELLLRGERQQQATPPPQDPAALDQYRAHLLTGNRKDALECAMTGGLWGHALHLADALGDRRARAAVSARFLNALPPADPLHTLYATLAGRAPPAAAASPDTWRTHLAVLLANPAPPAAVVALGDALAARGLPYSAQFCYLMGGEQFAPHPQSLLPAHTVATAPRLSLLLATAAQHASECAIAATEVYEYACGLSQAGFVLPELQPYKWLAATRLLDAGDVERAAAYAERLCAALHADPHRYSPLLVRHAAALGDRLRYADPAVDPAAADLLLAHVQQQDMQRQHEHLYQHQHEQTFQAAPAVPAAPAAVPMISTAPAAPTMQPAAPMVSPAVPTLPQPEPDWTHSPHHQPHHVEREADPSSDAVLANEQPPAPADLYEARPVVQADYDYWGGQYGTEGGEEARPQITMPGARRRDTDNDIADNDTASERRGSSDVGTSGGAGGSNADKDGGKAAGGSGWLGGIFNKLSLKPKNQMILPDDKNPSIVWDEDRKRWRNVDGDVDEQEQPPPPPPTLNDLANSQQRSPAPAPAGASPGLPPPAPAAGNMFKMQRGRHIKKAYVDVFNPNGGSPAAQPAPPAPAVPAAATTPAFFVPSMQ